MSQIICVLVKVVPVEKVKVLHLFLMCLLTGVLTWSSRGLMFGCDEHRVCRLWCSLSCCFFSPIWPPVCTFVRIGVFRRTYSSWSLKPTQFALSSALAKFTNVLFVALIDYFSRWAEDGDFGQTLVRNWSDSCKELVVYYIEISLFTAQVEI